MRIVSSGEGVDWAKLCLSEINCNNIRLQMIYMDYDVLAELVDMAPENMGANK